MLRKLTVHVKVEAQAADDSPLAPLVAAALQEFVARLGAKSAATGKFESKAGLDVSWATKNEYFDDKGNPMDPPKRSQIAVAVKDAINAETVTKGSA